MGRCANDAAAVILAASRQKLFKKWVAWTRSIAKVTARFQKEAEKLEQLAKLPNIPRYFGRVSGPA